MWHIIQYYCKKLWCGRYLWWWRSDQMSMYSLLSAGLKWLSYTATKSKKIFHFFFYVNPVITSKYDFGIYKYPFTWQDLNPCCLGGGKKKQKKNMSCNIKPLLLFLMWKSCLDIWILGQLSPSNSNEFKYNELQ